MRKGASRAPGVTSRQALDQSMQASGWKRGAPRAREGDVNRRRWTCRSRPHFAITRLQPPSLKTGRRFQRSTRPRLQFHPRTAAPADIGLTAWNLAAKTRPHLQSWPRAVADFARAVDFDCDRRMRGCPADTVSSSRDFLLPIPCWTACRCRGSQGRRAVSPVASVDGVRVGIRAASKIAGRVFVVVVGIFGHKRCRASSPYGSPSKRPYGNAINEMNRLWLLDFRCRKR